jgi:cytochrome c-type biogenesis protein CcmH/NrfG
MNRFIVATLALAASSMPVLATAQDPLVEDAEERVDGAVAAEEYAEEEYAEEQYEEEFCGGDEWTVVDEAYQLLGSSSYEEARQVLVTALREGGVDTWRRGQALAMLAEAQLHLGEYSAAVLNYRKALRIDAHGATSSSSVGLATALYLRGARGAAHQQAISVVDAVCGDPYGMVGCYAAQAVIAATTRDPAERDTARATMAQLRAAHSDHAESFDRLDQRIATPARPPRA